MGVGSHLELRGMGKMRGGGQLNVDIFDVINY